MSNASQEEKIPHDIETASDPVDRPLKHGAGTPDDEAAKVLNSYHGPEAWSDVEEAKLRKRVDWRLMPILCLTYGLQYYDKAMLSQAALFGLIPELQLNVDKRYSLSASIFYMGFIAGRCYWMIVVHEDMLTTHQVHILPCFWPSDSPLRK
jgi:hypothetical protein